MPDMISVLLPVFSTLIVLLIVVGVISLFVSRRKPTISYPYKKQPVLFTPAERSFLGVLEQAVGSNYRVFGKVRLADVIKVNSGLSRANYQAAFNRIKSKHLDYVVCDPNDLSIQFAVELDDSSHSQSKRRNRDNFLNDALKAAEVPLFRFPAKQTYSVQEIKSLLFTSSESESDL